MRQIRAMVRRTIINRGVAVLALGAVLVLAPMAAMADDTVGIGMSSTGGAATITPIWQQGNAQGDGSGR